MHCNFCNLEIVDNKYVRVRSIKRKDSDINFIPSPMVKSAPLSEPYHESCFKAHKDEIFERLSDD